MSVSLLVVFFALAVSNAARADGLKDYVNARFGFAIEVPTWLTIQPPPANGDGRSFESGDGAVKLSA